jgi:tetratricopeptide (TPR) repeat protein
MTSLVASPLSERLQNALLAYSAYLWKTLWPIDLAVFYPFQSRIPPVAVLCSDMMLTITTTVVMRKRQKYPYLLFGWFWFLISLAPVIGIVRVGLQSMADRYTYMPLIGIFVMVGWGAESLFEPCRISLQRFSYALSVALIAACLLLSWRQTSYWQDTATLFTHALNATDDNFVAYSVLGRYEERKGRLEEALHYYNQALEIAPWYEYAKIHQGIILMNQGRLDAAVFKYNEAILQNPTSVTGHINLGIVMALQGRTADAIRNFKIALDFDPLSAAAHYNLGMELVKTGKMEEAIQHYILALKIDPGDVTCHNNLGIALAELGRLDEAISHFSKALNLKPDFFDAYNNMQLALKKRTQQSANNP